MASADIGCVAPPESVAVSKANNHLAIHLYKLLAKEKTNVFFSPFSLSTAFAMLFCGSENQTAEEMRSVLGYAEAGIKDQDVKLYFQRLLNEIESGSDGYTLACANSMLTDKGFPVKQGFKSLTQESFKALIQEVDIQGEIQNTIQQVNAWVAGKTNNMITQLLDTLDPNTVVVILNAVYFKGFWLHQFKERDTFLQYFYNQGLEDNAKQVEMMHLKSNFSYLENQSFKALYLPYKEEDIAMLILLPHSKNGLDELEKLLTPGWIYGLKHEMRRIEVEVALPKFRLEYSKSLNEQFQAMGVNRAFYPGAHFGGISDCEELLLSQIVHKAVLEVNEEGAEASAATKIGISKRCIQFCPEFIVDHPFLFFISNLKTDIILFMGRVDEL